MESPEPWRRTLFVESMVAGAVAGFVCDLTLYPLDTLKTRMQAPGGLRATGGLFGAYRGVGITLAGSVPCSALFFSTYEMAVPVVDDMLTWWTTESHAAAAERGPLALRQASASSFKGCELRHCVVNAIAAALGEFVAATIRTPIEALKQRRQVYLEQPRGGAHVLWRGWAATLARDMPFSIIQYPLYHAAKRYCCRTPATTTTTTSSGGGSPGQKQLLVVHGVDPTRAALCGSLTSATAAALTTPFDVVQTRVMLADRPRPILAVVNDLVTSRGGGLSSLFAGAAPRAAWMGLAGLLFLGSYEHAKCLYHETTGLGCDRATPPPPQQAEHHC